MDETSDIEKNKNTSDSRKILFIINQLGGGGAERVLVTLANNFAKVKNYTVSILSFKRTSKPYKIDDRINVLKLADKNYSRFQSILLIRRIIRTNVPDVIISFEDYMNIRVLLAATGIKINCIVSVRNDPARSDNRLVYKHIRNFLYRRAKAIICQTPDEKAYFPQYIQNKCEVIPNPVTDSLPEPYKGERSRYIVNFCRLTKQKNLPLLIEAFEVFYQTHSDYELRIYGDGELRDDLIKLIKNKRLDNCVHIYPARSDIHIVIRDAAMYISSSDYEGLSNSMLEAMAMGIPVICTDCPAGGARMLIKNGENGLLVPVGNIDQLVSAIEKVADDKAFADKISKNATVIRSELSERNITEKWENLLR